MKLGVFGGGFKPFTTGHMSKLSLALQENDKVIFFYSTVSRSKGSSFVYTERMAREIFNIVSVALKRTYGNKILINPLHTNKEGKAESTPVQEVYKTIEYVATDSPDMMIDYGINPSNVDLLTVYSDANDIKMYTRNIGGTNEEKYFGDLIKTGRLKFDTGLTEKGEIDRMIASMRNLYPGSDDEELSPLINVRGSEVRSCAIEGKCGELRRYLPDFLNTEEKDKIIDIMSTNQKLTSESLLRAFVKCSLIG